jgi:hypothetical protein
LLSFEISQSAYGMYVKYLMAGFLVVFAVTMIIQFVAYVLSSVADIVDPLREEDEVNEIFETHAPDVTGDSEIGGEA